MTDAPINQPTTGTAQPIQALDPPPEGQLGISLIFPFGPGILSQQAAYQLNQPGSLPLSQVVTLCIDNTQNRQSLTVVHGAFSETTIVPAGAFQIVPTFSTKTAFNIFLSVSTAALAFNVNVIALNYARPAGSSTISANTLNNTGSANYYFSKTYLMTSLVNVPLYQSNNSFILSEVEITVDYMIAVAAGGCTALIDLSTLNTPDGAGGANPIATIQVAAFATAAGGITPGLTTTRRTFPQGAYVPPYTGDAPPGGINVVASLTNASSVSATISFSGLFQGDPFLD